MELVFKYHMTNVKHSHKLDARATEEDHWDAFEIANSRVCTYFE